MEKTMGKLVKIVKGLLSLVFLGVLFSVKSLVSIVLLAMLLAGCYIWATTIYSILSAGSCSSMDIFMFILGGNLVSISYAFMDSQDMDRKHTELLAAIKDKFKW
jgi:hypothetical protein